MKPVVTLLSLVAAASAATDASIYFSNDLTQASDQSPQVIAPSTARLLFAQRLGLSRYHELGAADEDTLSLLNRYNDESAAIFEHRQDSRPRDKTLYILEGVEDEKDIFDSPPVSRLRIQKPPCATDNLQLLEDLREQSRHAGSDSSHIRIEHDVSLEGLSSKDGERYTNALSTVRKQLELLRSQPSQDHTVTIVVMPSQPQKSARRGVSPYGKYTVPLVRRQITEEPLEAPSPHAESSPSPKTSHLEYSSAASRQSNTTLPHGILPVCHPTNESAIRATNNCSAHGHVYLKSSQPAGKDQSGGGNAKINCWACRCGKTTTTDSRGRTKTVYWGGPACQKKDVAMQFWLLAGLTVGLVSVVSWGVGLLVSVGGEELPSVIGAGVAGPRAR